MGSFEKMGRRWLVQHGMAVANPRSLARPWDGMTPPPPLGVVPLLRGVVLALTPPSTKNLSHAIVVIGGLMQWNRSSTGLGCLTRPSPRWFRFLLYGG
uniref:Uncharacterized protein n=1 Tax=Oryza barthii TaxID=65489 RepID=A0A0D3F7K4_9ORYZ